MSISNINDEIIRENEILNIKFKQKEFDDEFIEHLKNLLFLFQKNKQIYQSLNLLEFIFENISEFSKLEAFKTFMIDIVNKMDDLLENCETVDQITFSKVTLPPNDFKKLTYSIIEYCILNHNGYDDIYINYVEKFGYQEKAIPIYEEKKLDDILIATIYNKLIDKLGYKYRDSNTINLMQKLENILKQKMFDEKFNHISQNFITLKEKLYSKERRDETNSESNLEKQVRLNKEGELSASRSTYFKYNELKKMYKNTYYEDKSLYRDILIYKTMFYPQDFTLREVKELSSKERCPFCSIVKKIYLEHEIYEFIALNAILKFIEIKNYEQAINYFFKYFQNKKLKEINEIQLVIEVIISFHNLRHNIYPIFEIKYNFDYKNLYDNLYEYYKLDFINFISNNKSLSNDLKNYLQIFNKNNFKYELEFVNYISKYKKYKSNSILITIDTLHNELEEIIKNNLSILNIKECIEIYSDFFLHDFIIDERVSFNIYIQFLNNLNIKVSSVTNFEIVNNHYSHFLNSTKFNSLSQKNKNKFILKYMELYKKLDGLGVNNDYISKTEEVFFNFVKAIEPESENELLKTYSTILIFYLKKALFVESDRLVTYINNLIDIGMESNKIYDLIISETLSYTSYSFGSNFNKQINSIFNILIKINQKKFKNIDLLSHEDNSSNIIKSDIKNLNNGLHFDINIIIKDDKEDALHKHLESDEKIEIKEIIKKAIEHNSLKCIKVLLIQYPRSFEKQDAALLIEKNNLQLSKLDEIVEKQDFDKFELLIKLEIIKRGNLKELTMNF
ncbi:hypothetical protein CP965_00890 [Halarcobacter mediterraneus]|uniref:Uncharacterized protein n=1 Tax=Halarcobacter mediterraneus TaxID=2023153 RepID=A0A4Q1B4N3_9BACT|nr:hypothetical protein [Halarcobacter mediterraneus]RXK14037.1 hypothetical protein CP965_00890 [Halarcobacter mediterraneus]